MRIICRHCRAQLSRDEYFWFHDSCVPCETYRQVAAEERKVWIKSPLFAFCLTRFQMRPARHAFSSWLRNANIV